MERIKYLDGLKGIGAVMVFLNHYYLFGFPSHKLLQTSFVLDWIANAGLAVMLFITISGYLSWKTSKRVNDNFLYLNRYVLKKYLRFAIPFGFAFIILYISYFFGTYDYFEPVFRQSMICQRGGGNPIFHVSVVEFIKAVVISPMRNCFWDAPLWMMPIIFYGSIFVFVVRLITTKMSPSKALIVILFCSCIIIMFNKLYVGITCGLIMAFLWNKIEKTKDRLQNKPICRFFLIVILLIITYLLNVCLHFNHEIRHTLVSASIILAAYYSSIFTKVLESCIVQFLGRISFSIYIWHFPVLCSFSSYLCYLTNYNFGIVFPISFAAVILVSTISQRFIEEYSRKLQYKIEAILYQ